MNEIPSSKNLLLIFTKNPEAGKVKTRLAADVGEQAALEIYRILLAHTLAVTKDLKCDKEVHYSEKIPENDLWKEEGFTQKLQQGKDLGARMDHAFAEAFRNGYEKVIIIGSDLYDLEQKDLEKAFDTLEEHDFVIGPAEDGGYYLLGMREPTPEIFSGKNWSTSTVLQETLADLEGRQIKLLDTRNDIDYYDDVKQHKEFQRFLKHLTI